MSFLDRPCRAPARSACSAFLLAVAFVLTPALSSAGSEEREERSSVRSAPPTPGIVPGTAATLLGSAVVNFADLARLEKLGLVRTQAHEPRPLIFPETINEMDVEPGANIVGSSPQAMFSPPTFVPFVASPSPSQNYMGLDDVPMVDSSYIVIPPDVAGGVGPTKVMESFNNNYRIRDKATGATQLTVGTATFWNPVVTNKALLNGLTDPRTCYDPIQNRWLVAMQTTNSPGIILFGVSFTSDPAGSWHLYAVTPNFNGGAAPLLDFPILGFNKNWMVVTINAYTSGGAFSRGGTLIANYLLARAGTLGGVTLVTQAAGTHFATAPCQTISATEDTLYLVTHLSSGSATYEVDRITGTPAAPVYASGGTQTRPGGGWVQPSGNQLPQSAPNSGTSACGATPCPIESQDSQIRSAPVYRVDSTTGRGFIYYTQTVGLPSGTLTHTGVQWTKVTASTTPAFADGGRIEDATATSINGGKWYAYPHIAVNSAGDFIVGYSQFSSAQHPSAGYSFHFASDGLGTIRDPLIYKAGDDYYHKTFSTATGRNRWGDFSTAQVDPNDDLTLWTLQEYAKTRPGTDDGNTGSNSSKWSSWWAAVGPPTPTVTIAPGPSLNEGNAGTTAFNFTVNLSAVSGSSVTVNYQTSDGSATVADNDYQAATSSIVIPGGSPSGTITVLVNGDTKCEPDETFHVTLTGATNGTIGSPSVSTGTILNDEVLTITATAGSGGSISPSGASTFSCGANQTYTISPSDKCHAILDVKVDGVSVGAVASYPFTNITANHTIDATFVALGPFKVSASAGAGGSISPDGSVVMACGASQKFSIGPADKCHAILDVKVDGVSVGAVASYTFTDVQANHTIDATFMALGPFKLSATAGGGGSISPSGSVVAACSDSEKFSIEAADKCHAILDVKVDGVSVGPVSSYTFMDVQANHDIAASFSTLGPFKISASAGSGGSISPNGSSVVACGGTQGYTVTPSPGFVINDVKADGVSQGPVSSYTFNDVQANHTITASFTEMVAVLEATFLAKTVDDGVELRWDFGNSMPPATVTLERSDESNGPWAAVAADLRSDQGATVALDRRAVAGQTYYYRLSVTEMPGRVTMFGPVVGTAGTPIKELALTSVAPNPTMGTVQIEYAVPRDGPVQVRVLDIEGRAVAVLTAGTQPRGRYHVVWSGQTPRGAARAGIYFIQLQAAGRSVVRRLALVR